MAMTLEQKRQLAIQSLKEKIINKMKKIKSSDDTIENILYNISDEAERNLLRIFDYCQRQFEYQYKYFELNNTIFVPNIYCNKNKTFYILNFIDQYTGSDRKKIINKFINLYPNEKIKQISLKQYRKIIKWFQDDILFESEKYKINFSLDNRVRLKCLCCGKKFFGKNKKDKYCSNECAVNAHNNKTNKSILRSYYSGYYMDIHHYVRSGWEHNIARILQWNELNYDYEYYTFKLSNGSTHTPDFYIYADNTFYEIKGEMRTNTLAKYNMFKEEYPDKKLIIIDGEIYKELLKQYPNINFNLHINCLNITNQHLINKIKYRHNKIEYELWELDYKFYTNKRYYDKKHNITLLNISQTLLLLNMSNIQQLMYYINTGKIEYYYINNTYQFAKDYIQSFYEEKNKPKEYTLNIIKKQIKIANILTLPNLSLQELKNKNLINDEIYNIMCILQYLNINAIYNHQKIIYSINREIISQIYIPQENNHYFIIFNENTAYKKLIRFIYNTTNQYNIIIIDKQTYITLLNKYLQYIPNLIITNKKQCLNCNNYFIALDYNHQLYCSAQCQEYYIKKYKKKHYTCICDNCKKQYIVTSKTTKEKQICRDCYQIVYNNTDIKRQQANKMLIKNLKHIHWHINNSHIPFNNEAENNFALILEYLNNEYTYEDDYRYIDNNQYIYQFNFFRKKNNTIYILEFCLTYTIKLKIKSFLNEYNEKVHIITRKKYERILKFFNTKINFIYNRYPLQYYVLHICPICNKKFYANIQRIYCSNQCKHKNINKKANSI